MRHLPNPLQGLSGARVALLVMLLTLVFTLPGLETLRAADGDAASEKKPNIILIVADDLGWHDLSCYGADLHQSPNLDQLAADGVRFTNAYAASPVCSPTRASILTGQYPARLHLTIWLESAKHQPPNRPLLEPLTEDHLDHGYVTLAERLHEAGYYTAHVGKWHLGQTAEYPETHGFDVNVGGTYWGAPSTFFYPFKGTFGREEELRFVPGLEPGEEGDYLTDRLTDRALEIIDYATKDQPLYLNLWYHSVHTPIEGKPEIAKAYEGKLTPEAAHQNAHYAAMVQSLDENVGRVLAKLEEKGLADDTIVFFVSDNGGYIGRYDGIPVTNNSPLRSGKGSAYEGGIRIPWIVRWPGHTPEGVVCDEPVFTCDLYPTVLKMTGLASAEEHGDQVDGVELTGLLEAPDKGLPAERDLYFHYPHYYATTSPVSAIRSGDWKLVHYLPDGPTELYKLSDDLGETLDLAGDKTAVRDELMGRLHAWLKDVDAQMPAVNADFQPKPKAKPQQ